MQSGETDCNPVNKEPDVGGAIDESLRQGARAARAAAPGSPAAMELKRRQGFLWAAVVRMRHYAEDHWWDGPDPPDLSSSDANLIDLMMNGLVEL